MDAGIEQAREQKELIEDICAKQLSRSGTACKLLRFLFDHRDQALSEKELGFALEGGAFDPKTGKFKTEMMGLRSALNTRSRIADGSHSGWRVYLPKSASGKGYQLQFV